MQEAQSDLIVADITHAEFQAIAKRANDGDMAALAELRAILTANPDIPAKMGDLALATERSLCAAITSSDKASAEVIAERTRQMRAELLDGHTSDIVRLAVDRVICTWLSLYLYDIRYPDVTRLPTPEGNLVIKQKTAAERRHQAALKTLATVKQLLGTAKSPGCTTAKRQRTPRVFSPSDP